MLAKAPFHRQPYIVVDFKHDKLLNSMERVREIRYGELPKHPGLYILHPLPGEDDELEQFMWDIWGHEDIGLFFDEATLVPDKAAFSALLRQGRSKHIPVISLSQRPVDLPRSVFSESEHISVFPLQDRRDRKTVGEFTPDGMLEKRLPKWHSYWYDIQQHEEADPAPYFLVEPVPSADDIRDLIDSRLAPRHRFI